MPLIFSKPLSREFLAALQKEAHDENVKAKEWAERNNCVVQFVSNSQWAKHNKAGQKRGDDKDDSTGKADFFSFKIKPEGNTKIRTL